MNHVWGLFAHPYREWQEIRDEDENTSRLYLTPLLALAAIPAIASIIGTWMVGWEVSDSEGAVRLTFGSALQTGILIYLTILATVFIIAGAIFWMTHRAQIYPTYQSCVAFVTYLAVPIFIAGIVAIYPLRWLALIAAGLAACYSIYLLYIGIPAFLNTTKNKSFLMFICILAMALALGGGILSLSAITFSLHLTPTYLR